MNPYQEFQKDLEQLLNKYSMESRRSSDENIQTDVARTIVLLEHRHELENGHNKRLSTRNALPIFSGNSF